MQQHYPCTEAIKRAETVIEQKHQMHPDALPSTISVSSCDNHDSNRNKLDEAKKLIMQSLKTDFYGNKPKPLLNNLQTPAYNIAITDEEYSLSSIPQVQEETKIQEFQN
jgi:hypothetical protein